MQRNRLYLALAAASIVASDASAQSKAPPPEMLPKDAPKGPVGRSWAKEGADVAAKVLNAEAGVVDAGNTLTSTKIDGLLAAAEIALGTPEDRSSFISGMDTAFITHDGGSKKTKTHQNYLADVRRVFAAIDTEGFETVKEKLSSPGTYADRVGKLPSVSKAGGTNKGTGAKAAVAAAKEAHAAGTDVKEQLSKPPQGSNQPERSTTEIVSIIRTCHESQLPDLLAAMGERCASQTTASPLIREIGNSILLKLSADKPSAPATQDAPKQEAAQELPAPEEKTKVAV